MAVKKGIIGTASIIQDVFDPVENRIRVKIESDGAGGATVSYEDENFTSADNLSVLNVVSDLGLDEQAKGHKGYFINDGPGDIKVEISSDGSSYKGIHTIHGGETLILDGLSISKIRLNYIDDSSYRCMVG